MNVFISGATSGIGYEVSKRLSELGYKVYVGTHTLKQKKYLKNKIIDKNIIPIKCDITNEKDIKKVGSLDIDVLYMHAGIGIGGSITEIPINLMRKNYEINVFSSFNLMQHVLKGMIKKGNGRIVIMSSLLGIAPMKFLGVYSSTKASIISLADALRKELKMINKNIKVCLIEPGAYHTGFNQLMLNNKYDFMKEDSYFKGQIKNIRNRENLIFNIIEQKNLNSIVNKIVLSITSPNPKFIYRAPTSQVIAMKLYSLFKL